MPAISLGQLRARLALPSAPLVIDVRSSAEFAEGHVPGAINLPAETIADGSAAVPAGRAVVCVCTRGGHRSQGAAATLAGAGHDAVYLEGGWVGWKAAEG